MPISVSDHLGIPAIALARADAFDAILDVDSKLFIDPLLLRASEIPEFADADVTIQTRFGEVIDLLAVSQRPGDVPWRNAARRFTFPEVQGLCIGYSRRGTAGSGMGERLRLRMLQTAKEIIDIGVKDPRMFELMGLLEENIGPDRISDMFARITSRHIYRYSQRVFGEAELDGEEFTVGDEAFQIPRNPYSGAPILLVPRSVLRALPVADSWDDIDRVVSFNSNLRDRVNALIGDKWKRARYLPKRELRARLLSSPETFRGIIEAYDSVKARPYDFAVDPHGQVVWYSAARRAVREFPLALHLAATLDADAVLAVVLEITNHFKRLIEDNGLSSLLYERDGKPKREGAAQLLYYGIADAYCAANNLDLSPETDAGRGEVDFKVSSGYKGRVVAEAKLSTNSYLRHGYDTQVTEYQRAEQAKHSVYIVIDVGSSEARLAALRERIAEVERADGTSPSVVFINARPKKPASKYRRG